MTKFLGRWGLPTLAALLLLPACGGEPPTPGLARGGALYDTCTPCHGYQGEGNQTLGAPAIAGMPQWYVDAQLTKFAEGIRGNHPDDLEGMRMMPMARTLKHEGDIASVSEHVAQMPAVAIERTQFGDPTAGKAAFAVCMACHGADAAGNEAMGAPSLHGTNDWYLAKQIRKFKEHVRGADPRDTRGAQMAPMAATLTSDAAIGNVLAYIASLPAPAAKEQP